MHSVIRWAAGGAAAFAIATAASGANLDKKYICIPEMARVFVREPTGWQDFGHQQTDVFVLRPLTSLEKAGQPSPDVTWAVFASATATEPKTRCREFNAVLACGYPGQSITVNLDSGRFAGSLFEISQGQLYVGVSAGSCAELRTDAETPN